MTDAARSVAIVGLFHGNHLGGSLALAAESLGWTPVRFDLAEAEARSRIGRSLWYRLGFRTPPHLAAFGSRVADACRRQGIRTLIATGRAPLDAKTLGALHDAGVTTGLFSSDDPWNAAQRAEWYLAALPRYGVVFTPRSNTMTNFEALGCRHVRNLHFGYDERFTAARPAAETGPDVLFVGGADGDRVDFMKSFAGENVPISVVGAYWSRHGIAGVTDLGHRTPEDVARLTAAARVNLCVVRRANRDGHVMRTYEMAATGAAMVAEDTSDHRGLFGADGDAVLYFRTPAEAASRCRQLLADAPLRARLKAEAHRRIVGGGNTYRDRLRTMLDELGSARSEAGAPAA